METLKENYRELFENWNPFKNGRFVYQEVKPVEVAEGAEKKEKEKKPEKKPEITNEDAKEQADLSKKKANELAPSNPKEKEALDKRKADLKKSSENRDKKTADEKERHEQKGQEIKNKAANLTAKKEGGVEKKPAAPEKAPEKVDASKVKGKLENHLGLKLPQNIAEQMLAKVDPKKLEGLAKDPKAKLELSDAEAKAMGEVITKNINKLGEKTDPKAKENLQKIAKALEGLSKEDTDKMGLKKLGEKLTMFLQLFKVLGDAMKTQDFSTLEEVMGDITSKPPKNPADSMRESREAYKKVLDGIDPNTKVDDLLTAYFEPRGDKANELFGKDEKSPQGRYRIEAKTAIKDHLSAKLEGVGIEEIKKGKGNMPVITAYSEGNKIEIQLYKKGEKLMARVYKFSTETDAKGVEVEKSNLLTKKDSEITSIDSLKYTITTGEEAPAPPTVAEVKPEPKPVDEPETKSVEKEA